MILESSNWARHTAFVQVNFSAQSVPRIVWRKPCTWQWKLSNCPTYFACILVKTRLVRNSIQSERESFHFSFSLRSFVVYRQDVNDLCTSSSSSSNSNRTKHDALYPSLDSLSNDANAARWLAPVLILVPLRLGLHELDVIYEDFLKEALKLPQTVGIIGGSPRHAVYILGYQDDSFIDMDPHFCQTTVNVLDETFDISVRWLRPVFDSTARVSLSFRVIHVPLRRNSLPEKWIPVVH